MTSSGERPSARFASTTASGIRVLRMQAFPWTTNGLMVMSGRHSYVVVQELWCKIRLVGPHQRVEFRVNSKLLKRSGIPQWLKDWPVQSRLEIDLAGSAVPESKPYHVTANVARLDEVVVHDPHSKGAIPPNALPLSREWRLRSCRVNWSAARRLQRLLARLHD